MPSARTITAAAVNPGALKSWRRANLRSWIISVRCAWWRIGFKNRSARGGCPSSRAGGKSEMDLANVRDATNWFEVLQTSKRTQTAMMILSPGDATGRKAEAHEKSDQALLMLS